MAESSLSLSYNSLRQEVGFELGFGRTIANWTSDQSSVIDQCVQSGLRQFYTPPTLERGRPAHNWSFLRPQATIIIWCSVPVTATNTITGVSADAGANTTITATLDTFVSTMVGAQIAVTGVTGLWTILSYTDSKTVKVSGLVPTITTPTPCTFSITATGNYPMPDEFGGLESELTIETPETTEFPVRFTAESIIRQRRLSASGNTDRPVEVAIVPVRLANPASAGQRFELQVFPIPDVNYTLRYTYLVLPDAISTSNIYHFGGAQHAETMLQSCLETAARRVNGESGVHAAKWMERLQASIDIDRRVGPQRLGFSSSEREVFTRPIDVKYNGVTL